MSFWKATTIEGLICCSINAVNMRIDAPQRRTRRQLVADKTTSSNSTTASEQYEFVVRAKREMTDCRVIKLFFRDCRNRICADTSYVVLDLSLVEQVDTKLLATILELYQLARASSVTLEIVLSSSLKNLIEVCRLGAVFTHLQQAVTVNSNH